METHVTYTREQLEIVFTWQVLCLHARQRPDWARIMLATAGMQRMDQITSPAQIERLMRTA